MESLQVHMPLLANTAAQLSEIEMNIQKLESMPWSKIWDVFQHFHMATFWLAIARLSCRSISGAWCFLLPTTGSVSRAKHTQRFQYLHG